MTHTHLGDQDDNLSTPYDEAILAACHSEWEEKVRYVLVHMPTP